MPLFFELVKRTQEIFYCYRKPTTQGTFLKSVAYRYDLLGTKNLLLSAHEVWCYNISDARLTKVSHRNEASLVMHGPHLILISTQNYFVNFFVCTFVRTETQTYISPGTDQRHGYPPLPIRALPPLDNQCARIFPFSYLQGSKDGAATVGCRAGKW